MIHVAVGVLINACGEVLVTRRHAHSHQGGLLEFPGGKLEPGEGRFAGLQREFLEELGLQITAAHPLKKIVHHYTDKSVLLDVWHITDFSGAPTGVEGQPVYWIPVNNLDATQFPAANARIVSTLKLPAELAITPDVNDLGELLNLLQQYISKGARLIQLRQKSVTGSTYRNWYEKASELCAAQDVRIMYSHVDPPVNTMHAHGYHCPAQTLMSLEHRPVFDDVLFAASCHSLDELRHAEALDADYVTLSPVLPTPKYANQQLLGWDQFADLRSHVSLPVFALGGLSRTDAESARKAGAQGIAGIRLFTQ